MLDYLPLSVSSEMSEDMSYIFWYVHTMWNMTRVRHTYLVIFDIIKILSILDIVNYCLLYYQPWYEHLTHMNIYCRKLILIILIKIKQINIICIILDKNWFVIFKIYFL